MRPGTDLAHGDPRVRALLPPPGTALYVHVPFCVEKCTYCDFFSIKADGQDVSGTVDALLAEAAVRAPAEPTTVFIGGGTPSLLHERDLTRLLDGLDSITGFRRSAQEVTVESNPESLTLEKAALLRQLGADRISIGFQSFDVETLKLFGRVHSVEDSFAAFEAARKAGFRRVNVDVIYAVPDQAVDSWLVDLRRVIDLRPEHVSAYALAYEEGTALTRWMEAGTIERFHEDEELSFFLETRSTLESCGYEPYEISNFALPGQRCLHNCNYWMGGNYIGIGPSAASHLHGVRMGNPPSITPWKRGISKDGWALSWQEWLLPEQRLGETWWLGLRTRDGVHPAVARGSSGWLEDEDPAQDLAFTLVASGLLEFDGSRFRLSPRGIPLADAVSRRFLEACRSLARPPSFGLEPARPSLTPQVARPE